VIGPLPEDISREQALERGSEELREAIEAVRAGRDPQTRVRLIWSSTESQVKRDPDSRSSASSRHFEKVYAEKRERAELQRTLRDPCPQCGTRMDLGCSHVKHLIPGDELMVNPVHINRAWDRLVRNLKGEE